MGFRERLREAMDVRGIKTNQLAVKAGLGSGHVSMILSGQRNPGIDVAARLARAVGASLDWLCGLPAREKDALTPDEDELLKLYRDVDPALKRVALEAMRLYPTRPR